MAKLLLTKSASVRQGIDSFGRATDRYVVKNRRFPHISNNCRREYGKLMNDDAGCRLSACYQVFRFAAQCMRPTLLHNVKLYVVNRLAFASKPHMGVSCSEAYIPQDKHCKDGVFNVMYICLLGRIAGFRLMLQIQLAVAILASGNRAAILTHPPQDSVMRTTHPAMFCRS